MTDERNTRPILVFAYGNPSRGDDALGPAMYELIEQQQQNAGLFTDVALLTDFQLQIEHASDLQYRERVVFIDASLTASPPYEFHPLIPEQDLSYTTHAMSPAAVLSVYQQINRQPPPPAYMLSIRGYAFGLGEPLSPGARAHLQTAFEFLMGGQVLNLE
ncbi:MAG: hydrogenase maturation protease [Pseudomonadota bacterium]|nr:hydrogenase maturation protease [Pseudomonadota bacterium]